MRVACALANRRLQHCCRNCCLADIESIGLCSASRLGRGFGTSQRSLSRQLRYCRGAAACPTQSMGASLLNSEGRCGPLFRLRNDIALHARGEYTEGTFDSHEAAWDARDRCQGVQSIDRIGSSTGRQQACVSWQL